MTRTTIGYTRDDGRIVAEWYDEGGEVYRAPVYGDGTRGGGRWESSRAHFARYFAAVHSAYVVLAAGVSL